MAGNITNSDRGKKRFSCALIVGILIAAIVATALITGWWVKRNIYASPFRPTHLSGQEQKALDAKLAKLERFSIGREPSLQEKEGTAGSPLIPEPYSEDDASREIRLSEKELNALVAKDPESAKRVAIDLSHDLVSVKLLLPLDDDLPLLGGKTILLNFGVNLSYRNRKPVVAIRGVSLGGIPLPGAWWGDIKNRDLVEEFGSEGGFWHQFSKGIENMEIREGHLLIKLRE